MNFKKNKIFLDRVLLGQKVKVGFEYEGEGNITTLKSGCGCTTPINNSNTKTIEVEFVKTDFPKHLEKENITVFTSTVPITVIENNNGKINTHILQLEANIYKS